MRTGIWTVAWAIGLVALVLSEAHAQPASTGGGTPIAQAQRSAKTGDYFSIEGIVVSNRQNRFFTIRDDSGEMLVVIPEYITREQGVPANNERVRVSGKYDTKKLDASVKGMRVIRLHRLGRDLGATGASRARADSPPPAPPTTTPPAALPMAGPGVTVIRPTVSADLKERLRAQRIEFSAAKAEVDAAASNYADALYAAGDGPVDPAIQARLQQAEAEMGDVVGSLSKLLEEAEASGVPSDLLILYQQSAGMLH